MESPDLQIPPFAPAPSEIPSPPAEETYHPKFDTVSSTDLEVTLISSDRVRFRVSVNALRSGSGFFKEVLSLPQAAVATSTDEQFIDNIAEDAEILAGLLTMIMGLGIPSLDTFNAIEPLVLAAEKYDMKLPCAILRVLLRTTPRYLEEHMRLCFLGGRLGWDEVFQLGASHSYNLEIFLPKHHSTLHRTDSGHVLRLLKFHRARRDSMDLFLQSDELGGLWCCWPSLALHTRMLGSTPEFDNFRLRVLDKLDRTPPDGNITEGEIREMYLRSSLGNISGHDHVPTKRGRVFDCCVPSEQSVLEAIKQHWRKIPQNI